MLDDDDGKHQHPKIISLSSITSYGKLCYEVSSFWDGVPLKLKRHIVKN
jgi:hypothetical protein